jgi:hypothetical protein
VVSWFVAVRRRQQVAFDSYTTWMCITRHVSLLPRQSRTTGTLSCSRGRSEDRHTAQDRG